MNNPTKLRDITARMKYLLSQICEERPKYIQAYKDSIDPLKNRAIEPVRTDMNVWEKWYFEAKNHHILLNSFKWIQEDMHEMYDEFMKLNAQRSQLRTRLGKQLTISF